MPTTQGCQRHKGWINTWLGNFGGGANGSGGVYRAKNVNDTGGVNDLGGVYDIGVSTTSQEVVPARGECQRHKNANSMGSVNDREAFKETRGVKNLGGGSDIEAFNNTEGCQQHWLCQRQRGWERHKGFQMHRSGQQHTRVYHMGCLQGHHPTPFRVLAKGGVPTPQWLASIQPSPNQKGAVSCGYFSHYRIHHRPGIMPTKSS